MTRFSLYAIGKVARGREFGGIDDENFDLSLLPFKIAEGVQIEDISSQIADDEFRIYKEQLGALVIEKLEGLKYAIVHRFQEYGVDKNTGEYFFGAEQIHKSRKHMGEIAACLRLIRPIGQYVQFCEGELAADGKLSRIAFDLPIEVFDLPVNQRYFRFRNQDANDLCFYLPRFQKSLSDPFQKFEMAVRMYEAGHFQHTDWKARFLLWTTALEALFTTQNREHMGSMVAKGRIKFFLGASTEVYPKGELISIDSSPGITVADVIDEIYCLRNHIAHGDKVPDYYFQATGRPTFEGNLTKCETLMEAISSIIRQCLLKILRDDLFDNFKDAASSERYYSAKGLTKSGLKDDSKKKNSFVCPS